MGTLIRFTRGAVAALLAGAGLLILADSPFSPVTNMWLGVPNYVPDVFSHPTPEAIGSMLFGALILAADLGVRMFLIAGPICWVLSRFRPVGPITLAAVGAAACFCIAFAETVGVLLYNGVAIQEWEGVTKDGAIMPLFLATEFKLALLAGALGAVMSGAFWFASRRRRVWARMRRGASA